MSFFNLPQHDLEEERRRYLESGLKDGDEDVPVYNWGEDSYDGLGDALQEGGDELNDETFGVGEVGKDFDFAQPAIPGYEPPARNVQQLEEDPGRQSAAGTRQQTQQQQPAQAQNGSSRPGGPSLESIWDDKSLFSVLPKSSTNGSTAAHRNQDPLLHHQQQPIRNTATPSGTHAAARFSPFDGPGGHPQQPIGPTIGQGQPRGMTLQEIEAEMLAQAARRRQQEQERERQMEQQLLLQQRQQQQQLEDQRRLREQELRHRELLLQQQQQQQQQQLQQKDMHYQRILQMQQRQQAQIQQQQQLQGPQRTPPPRMAHNASQSPRFMEHQRNQHALILQQEQERQQQLLLLERERQHQRLLLQDRDPRQVQQMLDQQYRIEELEKRLAHNLMLENKPGSPWQQQVPHDPQFIGEQQLPVQRQFATPSPARHLLQQQQQAQFGHGMHDQQLPQPLQMQQRLLAELAQQGMDMGGNQEQLRVEAMRKILEAEKMEEKRRRKAQKLAYMARYNDLMTQSDKDFITRIQVSQLVTQDPYADDFYAQVYGAILRSRLGLQAQDERVLKFGSGGGVGLGLAPKGGARRPSAMQRMEQQVERIVQNARKREEEKSLHSLHALQGALGKTSGRSYKAAPRQLLQVDGTSPTLSPAHAHISKSDNFNEGAAKEAEKLGREALGDAHHQVEVVSKDPLTHREALVILEHLYDLVLHLEQLRRDQPHPEDPPEVLQEWQQEYDDHVEIIWVEMRVNVPLTTSNPHPFISLLGPTKGKKILPRLTRHLPSDKMLVLITLLVACFEQLDVVKRAQILDKTVESPERADMERETQAFLTSVMQSILPVISVAELRLVTGLLGLLLDKTNVVGVAQTRPGLALLTLLLSRVEVIKQTIASGAEMELPTPEESEAWQRMFNHLFQFLSLHFMLLFPSTRIAQNNITGQPITIPATIDIVDTPVWQFLAALALHASADQHAALVAALRDKILENVLSVNKGWVVTEEERQTKLANVNLFLHALGLDSSQINL